MKKKAAAIHTEITREIDKWLHVIFNGRRKTGSVDLEAVEMMTRSAMHRAGATAITELLQFPAPPDDQRRLPCPCGHHARYLELRSKSVLTVVGQAKVSRPYYLCSHCGNGQFPADVELDIEKTECSPGVRRMKAVVGQDAPFDHCRKQIKELAGLDVTAKSVERSAEATGAECAFKFLRQYRRARATADQGGHSVETACRNWPTDSNPLYRNGRDGNIRGEKGNLGA